MAGRHGTQTAFVLAFGALVAALVLSMGVLGGGPSEPVVLAEAPEAVETEAMSAEGDLAIDEASLYVSADPFLALGGGGSVVDAPVSFAPPAIGSGVPVPTHFFTSTTCNYLRATGTDGESYVIEICTSCYYDGLWALFTFSTTCSTTVGVLF